LESGRTVIIVPIYKKDDKNAYSNYRGISVLPPTYKTFNNIKKNTEALSRVVVRLA
jgi:hypothetical protein